MLKYLSYSQGTQRRLNFQPRTLSPGELLTSLAIPDGVGCELITGNVKDLLGFFLGEKVMDFKHRRPLCHGLDDDGLVVWRADMSDFHL